MFPFGAILSGDPAAAAQKATANKYSLDKAEVDQQADAAFGRSLQALYQGTQQQQQGPRSQFQPQMAPQQAGSAPQAPPMAQQPQGPMQAQIPGSQPIAPPQAARSPMAAQPAQSQQRPPMAGPQSGPPSGPPGPQSQGQGFGQQGGMLTLQQIIPAVQKALGPNADPSVFAAAVNKYLPLMNATSQEQWRGLQAQLRQEQIYASEARVAQGDERLALQRQRQEQQFEQRNRSLDIRARGQALNEAKFQLQQVQSSERFRQAEAKLDEAKRANDFKMVHQLATSLHAMVNERVAMINAGVKKADMPPESIADLEKEAKGLIDAMHQAIDQHASAQPRPSPDTFQDRFKGDRSSYPGDQ